MAFATGHTQRTGFVAGAQLKDGDSFGSIDIPAYNNQAVKVKIDLRYYKNTLFAMASVIRASDNVVIEPSVYKQPQWFTNIAGMAMPNNQLALKDLITQLPTLAKAQSLGVPDNGIVPQNATGELMPFAQDADGYVKPFVSAVDAQKKVDAAAATQQTVLDKIAQGLTPGATAPATTDTGTTGMSLTTKIIIGVAIALVIGVVVFLMTRKKTDKTVVINNQRAAPHYYRRRRRA